MFDYYKDRNCHLMMSLINLLLRVQSLILTQWSFYWPVKCNFVHLYSKYTKSYYVFYIIKTKNKDSCVIFNKIEGLCFKINNNKSYNLVLKQ